MSKPTIKEQTAYLEGLGAHVKRLRDGFTIFAKVGNGLIQRYRVIAEGLTTAQFRTWDAEAFIQARDATEVFWNEWQAQVALASSPHNEEPL